jgi:GrpB-like predicted nucleotidyltransferase (UPF0157 family)
MTAPRIVTLVEHSAQWAEVAAGEASRLRAALAGELVAVHHIGSTSIPAIVAKPVIDLVPQVRSLSGLDRLESTVRALGYQWRGELGIPGRRYCVLDDPSTGERRVQLHCFATGDPEIERMIAFRDYLRAHPEVAREYESIKRAARDRHPDDRERYTSAKAPWISAILPRALEYYRSLRASATGRA